MRFILKTSVQGYYLDIMERFDIDLFKSLKPIGAKMTVTQFTGSKTGDIVALEFTSPIKASWVSKIINHGQDENKAFFIDEGELLPFPLKSWTHHHIVERIDDQSSVIIDDITYSTGIKLLDLLMYPAMYLSFYPRKSGYRRYFNQ